MAGLILSGSETDQVRDLVGLCSATHLTEGAMLELLVRVERLLGCDGVALTLMDSTARGAAFYGAAESGVGYPATAQERELHESGEEHAAFWQHYRACVPCSFPDRAGRPVVISSSEVYGELEWRRHPMLTEWLAPGGVYDDLICSYPQGPNRTLRVLAGRGPGTPFGERERFLMTLLQPHLRDLVVATSRRAPVSAPVLTQRQEEIVRCVGTGMTNQQVARALGISVGTVRKHLEHIYDRLHVQSRTAAVTARSLTDPGRPRAVAATPR